MQRSSATERDQRELTRIVAALDGDHPDRFLHLGFDHPQNAGRKLFHAREWTLLLAHHLLRPLAIELYASAKEGALVQPPKQ